MSREGKLGSTLADEARYKAMKHETPQQKLERLQSELADWQNPNCYKGFSQAAREISIAGLKWLIQETEKRLSPASPK